jgi:signal transduction histidine kinase
MLRYVFTVILAILFSSPIIWGQQPLPIIKINTQSRSLIGKSIGIYIPQKEISIEEARLAQFHIINKDVPNLDMEKHSIWIKIIIQNTSWSGQLALHVDNPTLEEVEFFYEPEYNNEYQSQVISSNLPISLRHHKGTDFLFRVDRIDTLPHTYYIRIKSNQPIILPISVNFPNDQLMEIVKRNWLNGVYLGVVIIMMLYNFFIYTSVKDSSYLYYVLFILFAGLTQLSLKGLGFQYFWPNNPEIERHSMVIFASLSGIIGLIFTRKFLHLKEDFPRLSKLMLWGTLPFFISLIAIPFESNNYPLAFIIMRSATTVASILVISVGLYCLRKKRTASVVYFVIAWGVLIIGGFIYLFYTYGLLPHSTFTNYSVQLSSALEMTLLSFALASRINILEKEKEQSQKATLHLAQENERIVREQNLHLEYTVTRRTQELQHKNEILNETYEDLKQAQSKLVIAEKMSSLGQLTAGIAHEINNPINFVAANISPLKRDVNFLLQTIEELETISITEASVEDKKDKIKHLKESQDFDYLKTEINFLLNGIQDGATRTADIVKGLRTFSRIDEDQFKISDINQGLQSTLVISKNIMDKIELHTEWGDIPPVGCNPGKLNQVFLNIITNGVAAIREKFNNEVGGKLHIKTYTEHEDTVCIEITDNGSGMTEETHKKIFEPFYTTKKVGEGMGLGMSIVFSIIKEHEADIKVDTELGKGSRFTITLKRNDA